MIPNKTPLWFMSYTIFSKSIESLYYIKISSFSDYIDAYIHRINNGFDQLKVTIIICGKTLITSSFKS